MNNNILTATLTTVGLGAGITLGVFADKYHHLKNTPETVITKMETAKAEADRSKKELQTATREHEVALSELRKTKKQYQDEVRADIETKVREELKEYIEKADSVYEKAAKENEMAKLRLELAKSQCDGISLTFNGKGDN